MRAMSFTRAMEIECDIRDRWPTLPVTARRLGPNIGRDNGVYVKALTVSEYLAGDDEGHWHRVQSVADVEKLTRSHYIADESAS